MTLSRREARRAALTLLYQWDVTGRPIGSLYEGELDDYARETAEAVAAEAEELDRRITEASLATPTGGRGGFAGAAVQTRLVEQLPDRRTTA